jgi:hypothetical protein
MENQEKLGQSDEIDLGKLFTKVGEFIRNTAASLIRFLALVRRVPLNNKRLFIAASIFAVILTATYGLVLKRKFFESTMILSSNYLNKRLVDNAVRKLNLLAKEEDKKGIAKVLNIADSLAKNIILFESKPFISETDITELEVLKEQLKNAQEGSKNKKVVDQVVQRIEIENRHAFEITVRTYNPTVVSSLQNALVNYFRNNSYIRKRIESAKTNLEAKKVKLVEESLKLDSLKDVIYANYKSMAEQGRQGSNNVILSDKPVTNPIDVYNQDLFIYNEILSIERELYIQPDFEVVDGFTEFSEPASASLPKMLAQALLIAIGLSYVIVALRQFNKYLASFDATN